MSGPSTYQPQNAFLKWFEARLPIGGLIHSSFVVYPTPKNLNYWWTFGAILSFMLGVQIITGIVLAMHYTPHVDMAFNSVEHIMRDVNYGWLLRYLHSNGASMFFVAVYIHMFRGLYYGSYKEPREVLWILGVIIYLLMMATGFLGYTLPWGQMSFWGATVITNFFSAIPLVGESVVTWLWGGYAVGNPTLQRFFSLHYLLPFVIAGVVVLHIWALHVAGQNNPTGIEPKSSQDTRGVHALRDHEGRLHGGGVLPVLRLVRVLRAELSRPRRQLHPGQSGRHADAHRARMVLPAVLRDPARDPEQARRRRRDVRLDPGARLPALARHLAGEVGVVSPALPAVLLGVRAGVPRARLARLEAGRRRLRDRGAHPHRLLLHPLPHHLAAARPDRDAAAAAELDLGSGAEEVARRPRCCSLSVSAARCSPAPGRRRSPPTDAPHPPRNKWSFAGRVRQVRPGAAAARLQGLQGSLPDLPRAEPAVVPQPRRSGRPGLHGRAGADDRGRIQGAGRAERRRRDVRARRAARRPLPAAVDLEERGAGAHALQRHGAARHVGARQGAHL